MYAQETYNGTERNNKMSRANKKQERIHLRLSTVAKKKIERAAAISGSTVTDFVIATVSKVADQVIEEQERLLLSDRDRDAFLAALASPAEPSEKLKSAFQSYKRLEKQ